MEHLLNQALEHEFPAAPHFEAEIKTSTLQKVYEQVRAATQTEDGRVAIDKPCVRCCGISPILATGRDGVRRHARCAGSTLEESLYEKAAETGRTIDVSQLRTWMDEPKPMGLPRDAENMVILLFAEQTNRSFFLHSAPFEATLTNLPDRLELREQQLPHPAVGRRRCTRWSYLWRSQLRHCSRPAMHGSCTEVKRVAASARHACQTYRQRLQDRFGTLGIDAANTDRMRTAAATLAMIERLYDVELAGCPRPGHCTRRNVRIRHGRVLSKAGTTR